MRKLLVISVAVFFLVMGIEVIGFNYGIGDHPYYTISGRGFLGDGHDLTLLISKPLSMLGDFTLPLFFNFMFAFSIYFLLKSFPKIKYPEWAFLLAPIIPLASVYAQIFAASLFNFALGFFFRNRYKLFPVFLTLTFLAHYWSGLFLAGIFVLYLLVFHRGNDTFKWCLIPTMLIVLFFTHVVSPSDLSFLSSNAGHVGGINEMTVMDFLKLFSRGFVFFGLALFGLIVIYIKKMKYFIRLNIMLCVVPLLIVAVFSNSPYWNWRICYFIPLIALSSIFMSWLYEKSDRNKSYKIITKKN